MAGIDIFRGNDKQLTEGAINTTARPGAVDPRAQQIDVFPLDAFEFDDPKRIAAPIVRLKSPWQWEVQADVDQVIADVGDQNSASKLTPSSKKELLRQWEMLVETKSGLDIAVGEAGIPGTNDIYETFVAAYTAVDTYLWATPGVLISLTTTSTIDYNAYILMWRTMSEAEVALRQLLSAWIRQYGVTRSDTGATTVPSAPTLAARIMFNSAYLSWTAQPALTGVETTRIERSDTADFASHTDIATVAGHSYTDEGLALNGTDDVPVSRTYYYRVIRISNGTTESVLPSNVVSAIAASLSPKAIAANAINAAKIAAGSINDMSKFASTIRPPRVVTSIPTTPYAGYENGDTVVLNLLGNADHGKLFRLKDKTQATTIEVLPALGAWSKATSGGDIVADSITAGSIAAGAIGASEIAADAVTASKIVAGARNSPNDPVAYWSMDSVPEIPDDPAGVVGGYLNSNWTVLDGWTAADCTVSYVSGKIRLTATATQPRIYRALSGYLGKTIRARVRKVSGAGTSSTFYCTAGGSNSKTYDSSFTHIHDWVIPAGATGNIAVIPGDTNSISGDVYEISFIYIGSGAYLPNSLIDNSGNGNHGTIYGATPVTGISGKALAFNGVSNYASFVAPPLTSDNSFSMSCWFKIPSSLLWNATATASLFGVGTAIGAYGIWRRATVDNYLSFGFRDSASTVLTYVPITRDTLYFATLVYNGATRTFKAYLDGSYKNESSTSAIASYTFDTAGIIGGNNYLGGSLPDYFNGTIDEPRIYNRALTEAEIKFLYENKVTTRGMIITDQLVAGAVTADKIFAGAITTDKLAAEAVTAVKIDVGDLAANTAFVDALTANTAFIDDLFVNNIEVPTGGSIRYETGSGVQKRCVQLADEKIDWLDTPDTSPASPEQLRARIGRLGVGGSILMDGGFLANIESTWSVASTIFAETGNRVSQIYTSQGLRRVAYVTSGGVLSERVLTSGAWGSVVTISTGCSINSVPRYSENSDGSIKIIYCTSANAIVEKTFTTSWSPSDTTLVASGYRPNYIRMDSGIERLSYSTGANLYEIVRTGGTWGSPVSISICNDYSNSSYIVDADGILHISYISYPAVDLVERTFTTSWGVTPVTINTGAVDFPGYYKDLKGNVAIQYLGAGSITYEVFLENGVWSTTPIQVVTVSLSSSPAVDLDGNINTIFVSSGSAIKETTLQRYAQIGAGIIESGSNSDGSWIKYGDGTMECWSGPLSIPYQSTVSNAFGSSSGTTYYGNYVWTFPKPFIATPNAWVARTSKYVTRIDYSTAGPASCTVQWLEAGSGTANVNAVAIGRWKA